MKVISTMLLMACVCLYANAQQQKKAPNIFIITTDGLRWQEVFEGANANLVNNKMYVEDTSLLQQLYNDSSTEKRREKLMPFFWNVIAKQGVLYGNRHYNNKVDVRNIYKFSYPGYNEIFTGYADRRFTPNSPVLNRNRNVLEHLNSSSDYKGSVVAFSSWNIFPYILNEPRSNFSVNSGYEILPEEDSANITLNNVQDYVKHKTHTRYDLLTCFAAKEYIAAHHPKVVAIGLGETDKFAHEGRYDKYLMHINNVDKMIAELWYYVQTDPFYKNNTTFIITTDHGRGRRTNSWYKHHLFVKGSGEVWMAMLGPGISPAGEMKDDKKIYLNQVAATVSFLTGQSFEKEAGHSIGGALPVQAAPALNLPVAQPAIAGKAALK
ncbi:alkaline phosphatase family protein [Foetidibacter luteolus]|uniref:alkaline phosphatase family protein n=1 Tax=Foetidibacter luteolus TaxID=2608880 RepID=UPI00129ABD37|nr:alkaline phosphatase family protein [Foetidibacter luteolus]